ncbi:hypothetical protein A2U01_0011097, partial [Trifolium medium]|nr:hypothetical protein [Trifolium medium]
DSENMLAGYFGLCGWVRVFMVDAMLLDDRMRFLVSCGWKGGDFAKFWGGAGFMRENKRWRFREVQDGFNVWHHTQSAIVPASKL